MVNFWLTDNFQPRVKVKGQVVKVVESESRCQVSCFQGMVRML